MHNAGAFAGASLFISVIADLPLMPELEEDASQAVVFETASGRIAEAYATGQISVRAVTDFYSAALPQLGWHVETATRYRREGEILRLEIMPSGELAGDMGVRYKLAPASP